MSIASEHFSNARKAGMKEYSRKVSAGHIGYLPSLEGILKDSEIISQMNLGIIEIPLKKVIGTYTHLRSLSFARNFMPLLKESEFSSKWDSLCEHHLKEGINDPIKVYEYFNWYYVIEGNKRVSVMKYFNAYSIHADVTRLVPKMDEGNEDIDIYYEFIKFNLKSKINCIWFSKKGSFLELLSLLENYEPDLNLFDNKYKYFESKIYNVFRKIYYSQDGDKLPITTGDALLSFLKIYHIPMEYDEEELTRIMKSFIKELEFFNKDDFININTAPTEPQPGNVIATLTTLILPPKRLKIGFVYARSSDTSGWTYGHELGRQYLEEIFNDKVSTNFIDNVPENSDAYDYIKVLAEEKNDVIFTTSPVFRDATLRCALEYPSINFFNCSEHEPYKHLSNYYGRTYEPRFLTGIIAGAMTKTNLLGYAATSPTPEVNSCINSFALGARMVNPEAKVKVVWTKEWNSHNKFIYADNKLVAMGADIISNRNLTFPREITTKFGVHSMLCQMDIKTGIPIHHLAAPIWQWGIFYEKIIGNLLNNTFMNVVDMFSYNDKLVNFWWGMETGVLDIYYSENYVPKETQKLVNIMKKIIINNDYNPFTGPIYDNTGVLRVENENASTNEDILSMDWLVENVEAEPFDA
jgi:basic membrane protein A and related proteins